MPTNGFYGTYPQYAIATNSYNSIIPVTNMSLTEKFLITLTPEPKKSFRKVRITNGDNFLTDEGERLFLHWLLEKHGEEFKTDVVDKILAEQEKDKR